MKLVKSILVAMLLGTMAIQMAWASSDDKGLFHYVQINDLTQVKYLILKGGVDINIRNRSDKTALYVAIDTGRKEIAKWLIEKGADVNAKNYDGITPFILVVERGAIEDVKYLISKGADVNIKTKNGRTPLDYALEYCNHIFKYSEHCGNLVKSLVENGAEVNVITDGRTYLEKTDYLEIVKYLVVKGANINVKDKYGNTLLMRIDSPNIVKYLIEKGLDVNAKNNDGYTPLMHAAYMGNIWVVEYLVEKGADVNAKDKAGKTALDYASHNSSRAKDFLMKLELGE